MSHDLVQLDEAWGVLRAKFLEQWGETCVDFEANCPRCRAEGQWSRAHEAIFTLTWKGELVDGGDA